MLEELKLKRLFLILVSLSMIFTFSSCDITDDSSKSEESIISSDKENNENNDNNYSISNVQTVGYWEITINSAEAMDKINKSAHWEFAPAKGNKFIAIDAAVKNTGDEEHVFLPYMVIGNSEIIAKLIYNENEYLPTELIGSSDDLNRKTIKPLDSLTGTIVFEVPDDAAENLTDMKLVFTLKDESCSFSIY